MTPHGGCQTEQATMSAMSIANRARDDLVTNAIPVWISVSVETRRSDDLYPGEVEAEK